MILVRGETIMLYLTKPLYIPNYSDLHGERKTYHTHEIVLDRSKIGTKAILVCSGELRVSLLSRNGEERLLAYAGPGSYLGEAALFATEKFQNDLFVIAMEHTETIEMTREVLIKNLAVNTEMIEIILTAAYNKISNLLERLQCATHQSTPICEQIARVLLTNRLAVKNEWVVNLTHEQIAQMLGRSRVAVTNNLGKLQKLELIRVSRKKIVITQLDCLQAMVGELESFNVQTSLTHRTAQFTYCKPIDK